MCLPCCSDFDDVGYQPNYCGDMIVPVGTTVSLRLGTKANLAKHSRTLKNRAIEPITWVTPNVFYATPSN